jgi:hypothetical protein
MEMNKKQLEHAKSYLELGSDGFTVESPSPLRFAEFLGTRFLRYG